MRNFFPLILLLCLNVYGQDPTGVIEGRVVDESGAVVPGAAIRVVNTATSLTVDQKTTDHGDFRFT